ncbi:MAG: hypothetical protein UV75_C0009G0030 [Candidatus Giovannonibacteria bacterium GW2011_GWA1_43_15]|uniref:Nucleotidyl transferase AbiEii/AbiGii toxin family protein n=1 Tax=Candidatus Giovannonibacteria bacterium GW2011_GWA2_44_26 TaxID=1618648 RepID=A0A0G1ISA8_9BACT|nr:MAG: hypothetical protein UV72_C0014G0038 [Candidatus Giovannonibacteria bacterium GW2011_GWB1_43_13]KKS99146.1 MAG: hypothetical protein UV75_C0009G0030 [Candidatus Giovannonibacteria bacterium GW2011_GWA1_43_15]KKT21383.1 MAG: hypothetical protein UW05_C0011G0016 [Candidatus Giovannonibacteria bacterium GW2011_GWC2_43_8]KKT62035.1 MAG: hypothetical protein UW55_C0018G0002 [Candidatus Giovannonibacteria bacterium GW2011_GWA2_44_26]
MLNEFFLKTLGEEGKRLNIPANKNRALIREYLQTRIIAYLYGKEGASKISFIGGTSLRLLRGLDRFSEDLDFDNLNLTSKQIEILFQDISSQLNREGFEAYCTIKNKSGSGIGDIKFEKLLFELKISAHQDEKLSIKINYTTPKQKPVTELVPITRFGFVQNVVTNTMDILLAQKMRAIFQRKDLQPRDFYDVIWFLSQNIRPNDEILHGIDIENGAEAFKKLLKIFEKNVKPNLASFKARLLPFLINEEKLSYLDLFGNIIEKQI